MSKRATEFHVTGSVRDRDRSHNESVVDYGSMTPDEFVDHCIDDNGLFGFIATQQRGKEYEDWNWDVIALHLIAFSRGYLTFSPAYLKDLFEMQSDRLATTRREAA